MKIILELFGASRDFSDKNILEFDLKSQITIKDFKGILLNFIDETSIQNGNDKQKRGVFSINF